MSKIAKPVRGKAEARKKAATPSGGQTGAAKSAKKAGPRSHPDAQFDVREYVPYLLNRATNGLMGRFTEGLRPFDLSLSMWRVLALLHVTGPLRFSSLATLSSMEPPTVSRIIGQLIERRLITKSRSNNDGRGVVIAITQAGRKIVEDIMPHAYELEKLTLAGFSDDESYLIRRLLHRLCDNVAPLIPFPEVDD